MRAIFSSIVIVYFSLQVSVQKQRRSSFFTQAADLGDLELAEAAGGDHIPCATGASLLSVSR